MRWGVNWQLVTGERRKKSLWSPPPPALLDSPTPPTACSHLLTVKSTLSKWELHSSFSFFEDLWYAGLGCRTFGCQQVRFAGGSPDKPQVPPSLGQAGSIPSEPGSSCCKLMVHPPPHTHTFRPRPHPAYCRNYSSAPWLHALQLCWLNSSTLYQQVKTCGCCLTEGGVRNSTKHTQLY